MIAVPDAGILSSLEQFQKNCSRAREDVEGMKMNRV